MCVVCTVVPRVQAKFIQLCCNQTISHYQIHLQCHIIRSRIPHYQINNTSLSDPKYHIIRIRSSIPHYQIHNIILSDPIVNDVEHEQAVCQLTALRLHTRTSDPSHVTTIILGTTSNSSNQCHNNITYQQMPTSN